MDDIDEIRFRLWRQYGTTPSKMNRKQFRSYYKELEKEKKQLSKLYLKEEQDMAAKEMLARIRKEVQEETPHFIENDDIYQLFTDNFLTSLKITELKKVGIIKISQIKELEKTSHKTAVDKLAKAKTIGKEIAEAIIDLVKLYEFKDIETETIPSTSDVIIINEKKDVASVVKVEPVIEKKKEYEKENGTIDVEKFTDHLVEENDLANSLLNIVLDLCMTEKNIGMIRAYEGKVQRIGGSNIIYNKKNLLVEPVYLKKEFDKYIEKHDLKLIGNNERETDQYFKIALKTLGKEYIKVSFKGNEEFYYTRKDYTGNRLNYIQFDIEKMENRMKRKLSFDTCKKITRIMDTEESPTENLIAMKNLNGSAVYTIQKKPEKQTEDRKKVAPANTSNTSAIKVENKSEVKPVVRQEINKVTKEDVKMHIEVKPIKSHEFVPESGEYVSCFEVFEVTSSKQEVKNKFDFDFTKPNSNTIETEKSRGYAYYIFNKINPKKGRYSFQPELQQYFEQIKFKIQEFFNS